MSAVAVSQQTRQSHRFEGSWRYSLRCEKQPASSVHDQLTRCEKLLTQKAKFRTEGNYMRRPHCTLAALASSRGIWVHSPAQIVWEFVPSAALWFMLFRSCCKWTGRLEEPRHFADFDTEGCQPETHSFNTCFVSRRSIGTFKTAKALVRIACGISCISFHFQVVSPQQRDDNSVDELWISVGPIQPHEDFCREAATGFPFHLVLGRHVGLGVFSAAFQKRLGYIFMTDLQFLKSNNCKVLCCKKCCNVHPSMRSCCRCCVRNRWARSCLTSVSMCATSHSICRDAIMLTLPMRSPGCLKSWSIFISILRVLKCFCLFASCANAALRQTRDYGSLLWFFKLIAYRGSHVSMAAVSNPNFRKVRFSRWLGNKLRKVPVLKRIFRRFSSCFYWRGARKWGSSLEIPPDQEAANNTALLSLSYLCLWCDDAWTCTICPLGS